MEDEISHGSYPSILEKAARIRAIKITHRRSEPTYQVTYWLVAQHLDGALSKRTEELSV